MIGMLLEVHVNNGRAAFPRREEPPILSLWLYSQPSQALAGKMVRKNVMTPYWLWKTRTREQP